MNSVSKFVAVLMVVSVAGCGKSVLPPPVEVTYREAILGPGMVVRVTNTSSHHLYEVSVTGRSRDAPSGASVRATDHLEPGETVEVGWLEFGQWVPLPGESIEVYVKDYAIPKIALIPSS